MQTVKAATNRAEHEQPSNMIIINLLNVLWQTQKYGINSFERTNCIYTLLNVSENLIHYFLEINNTNSFEKIDEENITSLKNFVDLTECCCQWIQIAKKESIIMSKFQIFKQFTDDVSRVKESINARIELAKILDPTFFLLDANAHRALATYAEIDVIINNCLRLQMNPNNEMMKKAMENVMHLVEIYKELEKMTNTLEREQDKDELLILVTQAHQILQTFYDTQSTNPIYIEVNDMQSNVIKLYLDKCLNIFPKLDTFNVDDGDKWCDTLEYIAQTWNGVVYQQAKACSELSILFQQNRDNQLFQTFVNSKDEILRTYVHFSIDFDELGVIDYAIGFAKRLGLPDSDPAIQKVIAEKQNYGFAQMRSAIKKCQNGLERVGNNMSFFNSLSYLSEKDDLILSWDDAALPPRVGELDEEKKKEEAKGNRKVLRFADGHQLYIDDGRLGSGPGWAAFNKENHSSNDAPRRRLWSFRDGIFSLEDGRQLFVRDDGWVFAALVET